MTTITVETQLPFDHFLRALYQLSQDELAQLIDYATALQADEVRINGRTAQRKATGWLISEVGNMLIAGEPELVVGEPTVWRLPVLLTSSIDGIIGNVGTVDVDSQTGQLITSDEISDQILANVALI